MSSSEPRFSHRPVLKYRGGRFRETETPVVDEVPLTVTLNGREIITFLASNDALDYLAVGFLKSEGFIEAKEDILSIRTDLSRSTVDVESSGSESLAERLLEHRTVTSGCGKGTTFYHALDALQVKPIPPGPVVGAEKVQRLMNLLQRNAALYRIAGGVHNAALCDAERIILFRDDIGRHNAIDKIHGECFLEEIEVGDKLLLTTGRISSEILIKAGKLGVPILVSRSSPTGLALDLAERTGITVVALVRGGGLSVYSHPERISRETTSP